MSEQDDMENWNYATLASKGVIARRYPYNYQMGLGQDYGTYDSPGVLTDRIAEQNQRGFYERWAAYMDGARTDPRNGRRNDGRATRKSARPGAHRPESRGKPPNADGRSHSGGSRGIPFRRTALPADRPIVDARADALLRLRRLGTGARAERFPAERQVSLCEADLRRLDARDALPRRDSKEGMGGDSARRVRAPVRPVRDGLRARVLRVLPAQFRHLPPHDPDRRFEPRAEDPRAPLDGGARRGAARQGAPRGLREPARREPEPRQHGPADRRGARQPARRRRPVPVGVHGRQAGLRTVLTGNERSRPGSNDLPGARRDDPGDGLRRARCRP